MCTSCLTRRSLLTGAVAAAPMALSGCDSVAMLVSARTANAMGAEAWAEINARTQVSTNATYQKTLRRTSAKLLQAAGKSTDGWQIEVFADPRANAFALPGGRIGVYEGMFDVIANEDQLAAIVGHEIGHLSAKHAEERMGAEIVKSTGLRLIAMLLNFGDVSYANEIAAALGLGIEVGLLLPFSRDQELEADAAGLVLMDEAGYRPREAVDLWRRMEAASDRRPPEFLATHPAPRSRIAQIEAMIEAGI
ncbi:M48 family metallopeptidase [Palleronia caenipelagi]|uniref:M48 family metallopeptidase n=1 Tax=Palleronia caenipelagi TaxID=2489174 RepID=A0A547Q2U5_9RHOB|nr:M48 family metallopeptidase [Palleronia caenipelagi]TRD20700.1 M48 family metallopeptidase [Palleronia caenipelagi]